jgi:hypothetical protein
LPSSTVWGKPASNRASRDWAANNRDRAWLAHAADRLAAAERLRARPDLAANLEPTDREYLAACRKAEAYARRGKRLLQTATYVSLVAIIVGLVGWINQAYIYEQLHWYLTERPFAAAKIWPYVLSAAAEQALSPGQSFRECTPWQQDADYCPEMVMVPGGSFIMGRPDAEQGDR